MLKARSLSCQYQVLLWTIKKPATFDLSNAQSAAYAPLAWGLDQNQAIPALKFTHAVFQGIEYLLDQSVIWDVDRISVRY